MKKIGMLGACAVVLALAGCGSDDSDSNGPSPSSSSDEIEIEGSWSSDFGDEEITSTSWGTSLFTAEITTFDNDDNVAITRNPDDADFDPGLFNRIVWTEPDGGSFYYCTIDFSLESQEAALNSTLEADASDPANSGCGVSYWTRLEAAE